MTQEIESLTLTLTLRWKHLDRLKNFSMTVYIGACPIYSSPDPDEARMIAKVLADWKGLAGEVPELDHWTPEPTEQENTHV
jgi:hypothetical protein